jgi:Peptidase_C39 like family
MLRCLLFLICLAGAACAAPIDALLVRPELWTLSPDAFKQLPETRRFVWTSSAHDSARAVGEDLTLFDQHLVESIARFDGTKLTQITALLYDRGDAGDLSRDAYTKLVHDAADTLNTVTKVKFTDRGKDASNAVHADGLIWQTPAAQFLLEYSSTKEVKEKSIPFRAEFVRLTISPPARAANLLASVSTQPQAKFNGLAHVKRDLTSGDVWIADVPMVDQGQKGYCVVATTERVMRYYGESVDENELAEVANTATEGGTSMEAMLTALKKLGARLHVRVHPVEQMEVKQLLTLQSDYNREARKDGAAPIPDMRHMIDVEAMFTAMKPDVLLETRTKNKAELSRFEKGVEDHINQGVPLLWSVIVGLFPEKGIPQGGGGHMRLIIGYNNKTEEILYSDSWGAGHELKRMPLAEAVSMTTGLTTLEPF